MDLKYQSFYFHFLSMAVKKIKSFRQRNQKLLFLSSCQTHLDSKPGASRHVVFTHTEILVSAGIIFCNQDAKNALQECLCVRFMSQQCALGFFFPKNRKVFALCQPCLTVHWFNSSATYIPIYGMASPAPRVTRITITNFFILQACNKLDVTSCETNVGCSKHSFFVTLHFTLVSPFLHVVLSCDSKI